MGLTGPFGYKLEPILKLLSMLTDDKRGVERNSGGRALSCKGLDPPAWWIDPARWMPLQFGLFSIPISGPQSIPQRLWHVLSCLWESVYKRFLAAY